MLTGCSTHCGTRREPLRMSSRWSTISADRITGSVVGNVTDPKDNGASLARRPVVFVDSQEIGPSGRTIPSIRRRVRARHLVRRTAHAAFLPANGA